MVVDVLVGVANEEEVVGAAADGSPQQQRVGVIRLWGEHDPAPGLIEFGWSAAERHGRC